MLNLNNLNKKPTTRKLKQTLFISSSLITNSKRRSRRSQVKEENRKKQKAEKRDKYRNISLDRFNGQVKIDLFDTKLTKI